MKPSRALLAATALSQVLAAAHAAEFTHGPLLGLPTSNSIKIWARTSAPTSFHVRYGTSAKALDSVSQPATTSLGHDNTATATLTGLQPGTLYHYQLALPDSPGADAPPNGTFKTPPDASALKTGLNPRGLHNLTFEFACGNNQKPTGGGGPSLRTYNTLLQNHLDEVDFAILNGDWLYEEKRDYTASEWLGQVGINPAATPPIVDLAPTITGVWENYKLYLDRAPNLARWHRHVPTVYTADDHELVNDIYGSGTAGFKNRRAIFRDIALQAWHDYLAWANPVEFPRRAHFGRAQLEAGSDILTDPQTDFTKLPLDEMANLHVHWGGPNAGVMKPEPPVSEADPNHNVHDIVAVLGKHQLRISPPASHDTTSSYSIGRRCYGDFRVSNCHFLLVDTRTHRHLHNTRTPAQPGRQMLGEAQEKWLVDTIKNSDADFFFVVSSVNFMVPHVGTGGEVDHNAGDYGKDDAWTVFLDQRERLINFWDALPQPVFVLTGDLHNSFAIKITDNVYEFASGPHNSVNHAPMADEGGRPVNGTFQYGPRPCDIRWSTYALEDIPRLNRLFPHYCIVQVNNTFNNPTERGGTRPVAYTIPHVIFRFYDGLTGDFRYAETIHAATAKN